MRMVRVYLTPAAGVMGGGEVPPANKLLSWIMAWTPAPRLPADKVKGHACKASRT